MLANNRSTERECGQSQAFRTRKRAFQKRKRVIQEREETAGAGAGEGAARTY